MRSGWKRINGWAIGAIRLFVYLSSDGQKNVTKAAVKEIDVTYYQGDVSS
jgi:hypothetical protein